MRKFTLLWTSILLLAWTTNLHAQAPAFLWASEGGSTSGELAHAIALDGSSNSIAIGEFSGSANFGSFNMTAAGLKDVYIVKYDANGAEVWAEQISPTNAFTSAFGFSVATDDSDNIYVTGYFEDEAIFGGTDTASGPGSLNAFIAKYDANGNLDKLMFFGSGGLFLNAGLGIDINATGDIYVSGIFTETIIFGAGDTISSPLSESIFILKTDAQLAVNWVKQAGDASDFSRGTAVAAGSDGVYIAGNFDGSADFSGTALTSAGGTDMFLAKYSASGSLMWAKSGGGASSDDAAGVALDNSGNVYVTGSFQGNATFGSQTLNTTAQSNMYLLKYMASGTFAWAVAPTTTGLNPEIHGMTIDARNFIAVGGTGTETMNFGSNVTVSPGTGNFSGILVAYDAAGNAQWAKEAGLEVHGVKIDATEHCHVHGTYLGSTAFDATTLPAIGGLDVFTARTDAFIVAAPDQAMDFVHVAIFPNPAQQQASVLVESQKAFALDISLFDALGNSIRSQHLGAGMQHSIEIETASLPNGIYFLSISNGREQVRKRLVVMH